MPYETAMRLTPTRRLAYCVILGELAGGSFDWNRMEWLKPKV